MWMGDNVTSSYNVIGGNKLTLQEVQGVKEPSYVIILTME